MLKRSKSTFRLARWRVAKNSGFVALWVRKGHEMTSRRLIFFFIKQQKSYDKDFTVIDKCVRKVLSFILNVLGNLPVSYVQNKIKKTTEKFTTEIFLCFDVHVHMNVCGQKVTWISTSKT